MVNAMYFSGLSHFKLNSTDSTWSKSKPSLCCGASVSLKSPPRSPLNDHRTGRMSRADLFTHNTRLSRETVDLLSGVGLWC